MMAFREVRDKRKREARKYTLREMCAVLRCSMNTALAYEQDPSRMSYEQAVKVAEWLDCDVKELF